MGGGGWGEGGSPTSIKVYWPIGNNKVNNKNFLP